MFSELVVLSAFLPIIIVMAIISGLLSGSETALTSINPIRLKSIIHISQKINNQKRIKKVNKILNLFKSFNVTLVNILILNTLFNAAIASLSTFVFATFIVNHHTQAIVSTIGTGIAILILCEMIPKIIAKRNPEAYAIHMVYLWIAIAYLLWPVSYVMQKIKSVNNQALSSEHELLELINTIEEEGLIEKREQKLIESAISFDEKTIMEVVKPLQKTVFLEHDYDQYDYERVFLKHRFSRIPIINQAHTKFEGFLHIKNIGVEFLKENAFSIRKLSQPIAEMDSGFKLDDALFFFQKKRQHLAAVYEERTKKLCGIITIEDVLEELVGKIYDEDDEVGAVRNVGQCMFIVIGSLPLKKFFNEFLSLSSPREKDTTLAKWFNAAHPRLYKQYPTVLYKKYLFRLVDEKALLRKDAKATNKSKLEVEEIGQDEKHNLTWWFKN